MARSASNAAITIAAVAAGCALAGCVTTQEKNARTLLTNARTLASETPVRVTTENPEVRVLRIALIRSGRADAVVVLVRSGAPRPITDVPISVGLRRSRAKTVYLNDAPNVDYYDTHIALIPARGSATWVLPTVSVRVANDGRLFAAVGVPSTPTSTSERVLPTITARPRRTLPGELEVALQNRSGVPQYGLPVYATALRGGRYVGAARRLVGELDGGAAATVLLPLLGTDKHANVALYAPPTIFK